MCVLEEGRQGRKKREGEGGREGEIGPLPHQALCRERPTPTEWVAPDVPKRAGPRVGRASGHLLTFTGSRCSGRHLTEECFANKASRV